MPMRAGLRIRCGVVAVALAAAGAGVSGQQPPPFTPNGVLPVLEAYLESLRIQAGIPGMSAAVVREGAIIWERGYGFQNVTTRVRATPDTPYPVGDMSATLAATLLLQCVEQRHLELDQPIARYGADSEATLRQVLSHAAPEGAPEAFVFDPERYARLGQVIEHCAPQPYRKSVAHRLLNRLAMRDSVPGTDVAIGAEVLPEGLFEPEEVDRYRRVLERMAVSYKVDSKGRPERSSLTPTGITTVGGLVSTVRDLAKLDAALDSALLLLPETLDAAWSPALSTRGTPLPTGLGWFVQYHRGERVVWHFGYLPNAYSSLIVKVPARNLTFILLANSDGLSAPFQLSSGDVTRSLFATLFLRLTT